MRVMDKAFSCIKEELRSELETPKEGESELSLEAKARIRTALTGGSSSNNPPPQ